MSIMRNIKLTIAYEGTNYHGFQRQINSMTVQQVLEDRLSIIFGYKISMNAAARTDAGVHAYGQVINFLTSGKIPTQKIPIAARAVLPDDIVIYKAEEVSKEFHARCSAISKIYTYKIYNNLIPDPFYRRYAWHVVQKLDVEEMHQAAQIIVGRHDFSAFRATRGADVSPIRELYCAECSLNHPFVEIKVHGTGFLYHMVRNIAGTLLKVGLKKLDKTGFATILIGCDRKKAGMTAPAQGLYLNEVFYQFQK